MTFRKFPKVALLPSLTKITVWTIETVARLIWARSTAEQGCTELGQIVGAPKWEIIVQCRVVVDQAMP